MSKKRFFQVVTTAIVLILTISCQNGQTNETQQARGERGQRNQVAATPIAVARAEIGEAVSVYTTTATLEAEHHATVTSRTTGVVREIMHEEGDFVKEGDVLLRVQDDDQRLAVRQAELALSQAKRTYERNVRINESGVLSPQDFDQTKNALETAESNLEEAKLNLSHTIVRAPFSGHVVRRLVDLGANVQAGAQIFEMMDTDPLLVRVHLPANRMGSVSVGQNINLSLDRLDEPMVAKTTLISPIVNPDTGTVKVTAALTSYPATVRPGDFAEARVVTARREGALLVPSVAVFEEQGRSIMFVVNAGNAERRQVTVGFVESGVTEIIEGISVDEWIVVKGQRNLRDGVPVDILEGPEEALDQSAPLVETPSKEGVSS